MKNLLFFLIISIAFSCSSSNNVVRKSFLQKRKYNKGVHLSFKHKKDMVYTSQTGNSLIFQLNKQQETDSLLLPERKENIKKSRDTKRIKSKRLVSLKTSAHKNSIDKINTEHNDIFFSPKQNETHDPAEQLYKQAKISKNIGLIMLALFFLVIPIFIAIGLYIFSQAKLSKYIRIKTVLKDENSEYLDEINSLNNKLGTSAKRVWLSLAVGILLIIVIAYSAYFALNTAVLISALLGIITLIYFIYQLIRNLTTYFTLFDVIKKEKSKWSKV